MSSNDYVKYAYVRIKRKTTHKQLQKMSFHKGATYDELIERCVNIAAPVIYREIQEEAAKELQQQMQHKEKVLA
jgi:hypothetical protein